MHHKQKALSLVKEIDEVLSQKKPKTAYFIDQMNDKSQLNSLTFAENKSKIVNALDSFNEIPNKHHPAFKKNEKIQSQINNSFKTLSVQTVGALTSLKNELKKSTDSFKNTNESKQKFSTPKNRKSFGEKNSNIKKKVQEQINDLKSTKTIDALLLSLKEKMKSFQENYEKINGKIDNLLNEMKGENNFSSNQKHILEMKDKKQDEMYYTFQKNKKEGSAEKRYKKYADNCSEFNY